jgi:hypothetical protein
MDVSVAPHLTIIDVARLAHNIDANQYDAVVLALGVQDVMDGAPPQVSSSQ